MICIFTLANQMAHVSSYLQKQLVNGISNIALTINYVLVVLVLILIVIVLLSTLSAITVTVALILIV